MIFLETRFRKNFPTSIRAKTFLYRIDDFSNNAGKKLLESTSRNISLFIETQKFKLFQLFLPLQQKKYFPRYFFSKTEKFNVPNMTDRYRQLADHKIRNRPAIAIHRRKKECCRSTSAKPAGRRSQQ